MSLTRCKYCEHSNPADAKFCNACGATLTLAPCPHCGAVNQVTAAACYQCHGELLGSRPDALDAPLPAAEISKPSLRPPSRAIVGTAVLAAVAVFGYYAYRQHLRVDVPPLPAASNEANVRGVPVEAGAIGRDAAAGATKPAEAGNSAGSTGTATSPSETPPARTASAPANQRRTPRQPVDSPQEAAASATAIARPQTTNAGEPCTDRVAALGLCTPVQRKEAKAATAVPAAVARPQATNAGEPCTVAVAALGLCTP
jgi:cytoskeletal protein RodZ